MQKSARLGTIRRGRVRRRRLHVQLAGHLGAHLGEDGEPLGRPLGPLLVAAPVGDLEEVDRQAVGARPRPDLVPAVERCRVVRVELDRLAGRRGVAVALLEDAVDRGREGLPDFPSEQLLPRRSEEALGLAVDVREAPFAVEAVEAGRHGLQHPGDAGGPGLLPGRVVGGAEEAVGHALLVAERPPPRVDPAVLAARQDDPVLGLERPAGVDGRPQRVADAVDVVGVHAVVEGLDRLLELARAEAEHREQPLVPGQLPGAEVPVEGADAGGVDGQTPAEAVVLVLAHQRRQLELGDDGAGELGQGRDVLRRPRARRPVEDAQRPDDPAVVGDQRRAQVGPDQAVGHRGEVLHPAVRAGVLDRQRARQGRGHRAQRIPERRLHTQHALGEADPRGDELRVAQQADLARRGAEQPRGQFGEAVEARAVRVPRAQPGHDLRGAEGARQRYRRAGAEVVCGCPYCRVVHGCLSSWWSTRVSRPRAGACADQLCHGACVVRNGSDGNHVGCHGWRQVRALGRRA